MYIIKDNFNEMDCVMIQQTLQARTSKKQAKQSKPNEVCASKAES